ncbi:HNH endonuclease [Pseudomonas sp. R3.Fl]|jgi:5-methylcytosine-specific restriction protein A|uniref:HNH endonuclease n=1 Tax=Pseudomonas sp. R3.Fl TaxID=2928708 RepID=UPI00201DDA40|nr:HNH endonuclease signature motif containing protein [Pseudomonas sp. R3.Fl]MCL6690592.1 HNH endonuclease [Pseudomonas sp. R3.Fl]
MPDLPRSHSASSTTVQKHKPRSARGTAAQRGYGYKWQKARAAFLARNPLCAECERHGKIKLATEVDHIKPHKGDQLLFWSESNWQGLCKPCHSAKTASEDGGFGNKQREGGAKV